MAFTGAKRKPLTEGADGSGAGFSQEGMVELDFFHSWVVTGLRKEHELIKTESIPHNMP